jgi:hypothetical protein
MGAGQLTRRIEASFSSVVYTLKKQHEVWIRLLADAHHVVYHPIRSDVSEREDFPLVVADNAETTRGGHLRTGCDRGGSCVLAQEVAGWSDAIRGTAGEASQLGFVTDEDSA